MELAAAASISSKVCLAARARCMCYPHKQEDDGDGERGPWSGHVHSNSLKLGNLPVLSCCKKGCAANQNPGLSLVCRKSRLL